LEIENRKPMPGERASYAYDGHDSLHRGFARRDGQKLVLEIRNLASALLEKLAFRSRRGFEKYASPPGADVWGPISSSSGKRREELGGVVPSLTDDDSEVLAAP
jgi:hypothetical protein